MKTSAEDIQKIFRESSDKGIRDISASFMNTSALLTSQNCPPAAVQALEQLYKQVLEISRRLNGYLNDFAKLQSETEKTNQRLEILYAAGIKFSSETEKHSLLQKAMDIVEKALQAAAGYIVLVDDNGEVSDAFGRNMNPEEQRIAGNLSTTVIKNTIRDSQPVQVGDTGKDTDLAKQRSILQLDIKSALCVPLVLDQKVMGAVYLDRRNEANPFTEDDVRFLIAFAQQIVRGINVSQQLAELEGKLIADATLTLEALRKEFHCPYIIGSSNKLFEILRLASRVAPTDASVVIMGESGVGKELVAKALHENSPRSQEPFVAINCGAIPADLLESELFGYEKGSFTGATKEKPGKIETADRGTLFLDEIAEMDTRLQSKLLRVLQTREIERIGSVTPKRIDIRIVTATNKNLHQLIHEKIFREDLYYRLKVIEITVPPLRDRIIDIAELANHFIEKFAPHREITFSDGVLDLLEAYHWPGNIRELENLVQRCVVLAKSDRVNIEDLPPELQAQLPPEALVKTGQNLREAEEDFRRQFILGVLQKSKSKSEAAKMLGVNRTYLYKILEELGIS